MLVAAALCPHPPMLLPGLTGTADVAHDLRARCVEAARELVRSDPHTVVVVGGAPQGGPWPDEGRPDPSPYRGRPDPDGAASGLPLSLSVGAHLLDLAGWTGRRVLQAVPFDEPVDRCLALGRRLVQGDGDPAGGDGDRTALLVLGDGSARRGPKAPGYLDPAAVPFDDAVVAALDRPDVAALAALDPKVAASLLAQGRAAWQVLAGALTLGPSRPTEPSEPTEPSGPGWSGGVTHTEDPLGVLYVVATWWPVA